MPEISAEPSVSAFLASKVASLEADLDTQRRYRDELDKAKADSRITRLEYVNKIQSILDISRDVSEELKVLKSQQKLIEQDIEEEVEVLKTRTAEPDSGLLESAYASTMARTMAVWRSEKKERARAFNQSQLRRDVAQHYSADDPEGQRRTWCHVLGMYLPSAEVKATRLVPKSLAGDEVSFLFGAEEAVLSDFRNGITLHKSVKRGLDDGTIAIVPFLATTNAPTKWMCILLDETKAADTLWAGPYALGGPGQTIICLQDLDKKELTFLGDIRPARRYLYFRSIISYLRAKASGNQKVAQEIEKTELLHTMDRHLHKSTLVTLARCISGTELPQFLVEGKTFESSKEDDIEMGKDSGMLLSAKIRRGFPSSKEQKESD